MKEMIKYLVIVVTTAIIFTFVGKSCNSPNKEIKEYFKDEIAKIEQEIKDRDSAMVKRLESIAKGDTTIINNRNFYYEVQNAKDSLEQIDTNNVNPIARWVIRRWEGTIQPKDRR